MGIDFQNVTFKYYKKASSKQLDNVTFHINEKNEFVTILGQTGSGKSTLVQHMNGLLFASSGIVDVFDQKVIKSKKVKLKPMFLSTPRLLIKRKLKQEHISLRV